MLRTNTRNIEANVLPTNASSKTLSWSSDDNNIATVTQTGVVKGVNVGTTNITATATDGSGVSATCKVTVNPVTINLSTKTVNLQRALSMLSRLQPFFQRTTNIRMWFGQHLVME